MPADNTDRLAESARQRHELTRSKAVRALRELDRAGTVLILLTTPLKWAGTTYNHVVLERRSSPGLFVELGIGAVEVNGYGTLTPEAPPPWGADNWRGGLAFLATVSAP